MAKAKRGAVTFALYPEQCVVVSREAHRLSEIIAHESMVRYDQGDRSGEFSGRLLLANLLAAIARQSRKGIEHMTDSQ